MTAIGFFGHELFVGQNINSVCLNVYDESKTWLIDTGASLSVIRQEILDDRRIPFHNETIRISGIGGHVYCDGFVYLKLTYDNYEFEHKFYVLKNFTCRTDGILGQDFLSKFNCILDFEQNILTVNRHVPIKIPLQMGQLGYNNYLAIPPRCEITCFVHTTFRGECVVLPKQLGEGVFLASVLVRPSNGKIPLKILNTRDTEVKLSYFAPDVVDSDEYTLCSFESAKCMNADRVKKLFSILNFEHLNKEEQVSLENICAKYSDVFLLPGDKLSVTNLYKQSIQLKDNVTPVYTKPYRLPRSQKIEIDRQISDMLDNDIIEESVSEWSSPVLLVPKKSDSRGKKRWRVVVDYRKLNSKLQEDKFPLPNITEILDSLSGAIYFSHLDLSQGYYQLELCPESRKYTAFTTTKQYQMKRLPMGLKTSPSAFSRLMTVAMSGLHYEKCLVYLDDLICFGRSLELHNKNLIDVFERLRSVNLKINPDKCKFLTKELLYLGHIVSEKGVLPDPEKTRVIQCYPTPTNADEVRRFVAFANYYRKFIPHFAEITIPLNKLCRKYSNFEWTTECQNSFCTLKQLLINPPILQYPNFDDENEFILRTDASGLAIGSVLCNKNDLPIAYASRSLNKAELNYPTIEKELLSIVWSVKHFRPYLFGKKFIIKTDHKPLVYLFTMNNPSSRLLKFRLTLEEYDYAIEYVKGTSNVAADALSRILITSDELREMSQDIVNVMTRRMARNANNNNSSNSLVNRSDDVRPDQPNVVEILEKPRNCVELKFSPCKLSKNMHCTKFNDFIYVPSKGKIFIDPFSRSCLTRDAFVRDLDSICDKVSINEIYIIKCDENNKFIKWLTKYYKNRTGLRIYILADVVRVNNDDDKRVILNDFHLLPSSGHTGIRRMVSNIKKYYFWPNMISDVTSFVKKCDKCQKQKYSLHTKQPMVITTTAQSAFDKIFLDIVGPLDKDLDNFSYILTLQCELTKYVEAYPLVSKDSISVARAFVDNFVLRYGVPREIASDRGTEFISSTMTEVCKLLNIKQTLSCAYHHESIGALENSHKSLNSFLRIQTNNNSRNWSYWIPYWCFSYNTSVHSSTQYTPYELVFGKRCNIPSNLQNCTVIEPLYNVDNYSCELKFRLQKAQYEARQNLIKSKDVRKCKFDKYLKPIMYKKDDMLLVRNESGNKFSEVYCGPFKVLEDLEPNVKILRNNKEEIIHKNRTKLFID